MERLTVVEPLRRNAKILVQPDTLRHTSKLPMKTRFEGLIKSRLKKNSFMQECKKQTHKFQDRLESTLPI